MRNKKMKLYTTQKINRTLQKINDSCIFVHMCLYKKKVRELYTLI